MNKEVQVRQQVVGENSHLYIFKQNLNFIFLAAIIMSSILSMAAPRDAIYFGFMAIAFNIVYLLFSLLFNFMHKNYDSSKFINYLFRAGQEVKELKGDIGKTSSIKNVVQKLYMSKSSWTQHAIIVGASGSGKTVFVNAIQKQLLNSGAGFLFLDGKGSNSMLKQVYGLTLMHGRENDFMLVNFGEKETMEDVSTNVIKRSGPAKLIRHTHKYNPMAILDKDSMQDILGDMIDTTGDNAEWAEKAVILGNAIGETLIVLRDLDLLIAPEDTIEVYTYEQLKNSDKKVVLTFALFKEYLSSLHNNIALTVMIDRLNVNDSFRKMVYESFQIRDLKERLADAVRSMARIDYNRQLKDKLLFIDDWTEFIETANKELSKKNDAEYTHDVAKDYWNKVFSIFSAYTDVLDTPFSEIDFKDIIMNQKILYITLPGLKNKVTTSILAKIIINSIKSVAVQKWKEYQITHPFTCFLDEANVWGEDEDDLIVQIGQMYRQTREAGITLCVIHQDGLGEKMSAIYGSANNVFALRVLDKDLAEHLEAFFGEVEIAEFAITDQGMETNRNAKKDSQRREAKIEKEPLAKKGDFSILDSGEGFCSIKGVGRMKFTTEYNMPIMFEPKEKRITNIPLPELMPKKTFLEDFFKIAHPKEAEENKPKKSNDDSKKTEQMDDLMDFSDIEKKDDKKESLIPDNLTSDSTFDDLMDFSDIENKDDKKEEVTKSKDEELIDEFDDLMDFSDIENKEKEKPQNTPPDIDELMDFSDIEDNNTPKNEEDYIFDASENIEDVLKPSNFIDENYEVIDNTQAPKDYQKIDESFLDIAPQMVKESSFIPFQNEEVKDDEPPEKTIDDIKLDLNPTMPNNVYDTIETPIIPEVKLDNKINIDYVKEDNIIPNFADQKIELNLGEEFKKTNNKVPTFDETINFESLIPNDNSSEIPRFDPSVVKDPFNEKI